MWGQDGEFLVAVQGVRAVVRVEAIWWGGPAQLNFHAIDCDRPFVSETGYLSQCCRNADGRTVEQVVRDIVALAIRQNRCVSIGDRYRPEVAKALMDFSWLSESHATLSGFADARALERGVATPHDDHERQPAFDF